jgi:hypothetical protein
VVGVLLRKFALVVTVSLLYDRPDACARATVAVLLVSLAAHAACQPYAPVPSSVSRTKYLAPLYVAPALCGQGPTPETPSPSPLLSLASARMPVTTVGRLRVQWPSRCPSPSPTPRTHTHTNTKHFIHCLTPWVQLAAPCTCTHTL